MGINKVILVGNLGRKPEIRYTGDGTPIAKFSVATSEYAGKDESGQAKQHTEWHNCTAWRRLAEVCGQYLDKGTKVYIEGRIRRSEYTGQDNIKRFWFEIMVDKMEILTPKGVRESVPSEPGYQDFPNASGGEPPQAKVGAEKSGSVPAPPNDVDLDPDMDLEEDEDFFEE